MTHRNGWRRQAVCLTALIVMMICLPAWAGAFDWQTGMDVVIDLPTGKEINDNPNTSVVQIVDEEYAVLDGGGEMISVVKAEVESTNSYYHMMLSDAYIDSLAADVNRFLVGQVHFRHLLHCTAKVIVMEDNDCDGTYTVTRIFNHDGVFQELIHVQRGGDGKIQPLHRLYLFQYVMNSMQFMNYAIVDVDNEDSVLGRTLYNIEEGEGGLIIDDPNATPEPTAEPTQEPTAEPAPEPTAEPMPEPAAEPTPEPTAELTAQPTPELTAAPTATPAADWLSRTSQLMQDNQGLLTAMTLAIALLVLAMVVRTMLGRKKTKRFYRLTAVDRRMRKQKSPAYDQAIPLDKLCERFRNYAASRLHLYYEPKIIRLFIAGLSMSRLTVIQGISGTGKTSLGYAAGKFFGRDSTIIPVQPSWRDRGDLLGYLNEFSRRYNETNLLESIYEAGYRDDVYFSVLDEMNIARVEYYFAELLSILELPSQDEWVINIVPDEWAGDPVRLKDGKLRLPANMWYIGTANNDDTTFSIADKVYDRAMVLDVDERTDAFEAPDTAPLHMRASELSKLFEQAQNGYEIPAPIVERLMYLDRYMISHLRVTFGNRIMRQFKLFLPVYMACGGTELEGLDYLLCKKVLRKLENQNLMNMEGELDGLDALLVQMFGADAMTECHAYLQYLKKMI